MLCFFWPQRYRSSRKWSNDWTEALSCPLTTNRSVSINQTETERETDTQIRSSWVQTPISTPGLFGPLTTLSHRGEYTPTRLRRDLTLPLRRDTRHDRSTTDGTGSVLTNYSLETEVGLSTEVSPFRRRVPRVDEEYVDFRSVLSVFALFFPFVRPLF